MKKLLLLLLCVTLSAVGMWAQVSVTFANDPATTEFTDIPYELHFTVESADPEVVPTAVRVNDIMDVECLNLGTDYVCYLYYNIFDNRELVAQIKDEGGVRVSVLFSDGSQTDPVTFVVNTGPKKHVVTFANNPSTTLFEGLPDEMEFTLDAPIKTESPTAVINGRKELKCYRVKNSYSHFNFWVKYYVSRDAELLEEIYRNGEFTVQLLFPDKVEVPAVTFKVKRPASTIKPAFDDDPATTVYTALPSTVSFTLSEAVSGLPTLVVDGKRTLECVQDADNSRRYTAAFAENIADMANDISRQQKFTLTVVLDGGIELQPVTYRCDIPGIGQWQEMSLSYVEENPTRTEAIGYKGTSAYIGAAVQFPASKMQGLIGSKIHKIRFNVASGLTNLLAWIRPSLSAPALVYQALEGECVDGWNEVTLPEPYIVTGEEIFVGYSAAQPANLMAIISAGDDCDGGLWVSASDRWEDMSHKGFGAAMIQAVGMQYVSDCDLGLTITSDIAEYYPTESSVSLTAKVSNHGAAPQHGWRIDYAIDDSGVVTAASSNEEIKPDESKEVEFQIPLTTLEEGLHTIHLSLVLTQEGIEDAVSANNYTEIKIPLCAKVYPRTLLFEEFTTIPCPNCPNGAATLAALLDKTTAPVAVVAHHAGYGTDEFTVSASKEMIDPFGVFGAPTMMIDRRVMPGSDYLVPPFSIGYSNPVGGADRVKPYVDYAAAIPAFVSLTATAEYSKETSTVDILVQGEKNGAFDYLWPDAQLTVYLTESKLKARTAQSGASINYVHQHVLRQVLTPTMGEKPTWDGKNFTYTRSVEISSAWKPENMEIVAFINRPLYDSDGTNSYVLNTAVTTLTGVNALTGIKSAECTIYGEDGMIRCSDSDATLTVYTADGVAISNRNLPSGLYIVKIATPLGHHIQKINL